MKVSRKLLTITFVIGVLFLLGGQEVFAQEGKSLNSSHHMDIKVEKEGGIEVEHTINLTNNTSQIITKYRIALPWKPKENPVFTRDGLADNISESGDKWLISMLNDPLKSGATTEFKMVYRTDNVAKFDFGLYKLYIPPFLSAEKLLSYTASVQFPDTWPKLIYTSDRSTQQRDSFVAIDNLDKGAMLLWGEEYQIYVEDRLEVKEKNTILNLIPSLPHQEVSYGQMTQSRVVSENQGNIWIYPGDPQTVEYTAAVTITAASAIDSFLPFHYTYLPLPEELSYIEQPQLTKRSRAEALYDHLVIALKPDPLAELELSSWPTALFAENPSGNALAYAYTLAGYLAYADIPHRIAYGYVWEMDELSSRLSLPSVWVETILDNKIVALDPFSEDITGSHFFDTTLINRLTMGYWNPKNTEDKILGMLSEGRRARPQLVDPFDLDSKREYSVAVFAPKSVPTAEAYTINLEIKNHSGDVVIPQKILWDAEDVTHYLKVNSILSLAVPPRGKLEVPLYNIVFPNLIYDGQAEHKLVVSPASSLLPPSTVSYKILYTPNLKLLLLGASALGIILLSGVVYSWRRKLI